MAKTFDQLLDVLVTGNGSEPDQKLQNKVHQFSWIMLEWKLNNLTNAQVIELLNLDGSDPELTTVKTHLNGLGVADTIALEAVIDLARNEVSATGVVYDKAKARERFGLTP